MRGERQLLLDWYGDMVRAYESRLTPADRAELKRWEEEHLGELSTSDWPGWEKFIGKSPQAAQSRPKLVRRTA